MLILSTFTSDYLQKPLQYLLKDFSSETVDIKYTDTNLPIWLTQLHSSEEKNQTITILFRLIDLVDDNKKINVSDLKENLSKLVTQIIELKKIKKQSRIVTLCPSPDHFYDKEFKDLENYFLEEMQTNKIHTLSQSDIYQYYALCDFDNKVEYGTRIPYIFEFYVGLACLIARKLHCIKQPPYKVIVVDCDNTLWTGVAGDIGPENVKIEEHNRDLQKFLVEQKENGVFICLCSKNEEQTVNSVFSLKEEMILKMSDVAIKKINRDAKSSNIKAILNELKLANAKNAMFIDDSEREIDEVSQNLPEIFCVLMPQTVEGFNKTWAFDINRYLAITQTDKDRLKLIQQEEALRPYFSQIKDPIESLKAKREKQHLVISKIKKESDDRIIARVEQIPKRTNQFNLFPFSESPEKEWNLENQIKNDQIDCFIATIKNKLNSADKKVGDNEDSISGDLTALAVCKSYSDYLLVNGFFLSCRNTGLEVEYALAKEIAIYAASKKLDKIKFKFKKTEVNKLAESFIDILCQETNKYSVVRFLLKNTKKITSVQSVLFYLFKRIGILPIDFNKALSKEIIFEFSVNSLIQLDPYVLMRKTMELNAVNNNIASERLINSKDLGNAKLYLPLLQNETATIEPLVEKFFLGSRFTLIDNLAENITEKLKLLLNLQTQSFPRNASLIHLGLDSLKATYLSASIYKDYKVIVPYLMLLRSEMTVSSLLDYIKQQKDQQSVIERYPIVYEFNQTCLPSFQEQRVWFAEKKESADNSANYHMTACYKVSKNLDIRRFETACLELIKLYDVFGTTFFMEGSELKQLILEPEKRQLNFQLIDLDPMQSLEEAIQREISKPWTMESSSHLIHFIIFSDSKNYHIFLHTHHAIFDAVSLKNCLDTLSKIYQHTTLNSPKFIDYPPQYFEFIHDQQKRLEDEAYQTAAFNFWKNALSKIEKVTTFPIDQPISIYKPATEQVAKRYTFSLSSEDLIALKTLAKSKGVTSFIVLSALYGLLIASYTFQKNITLITATNGRGGHPSFDKMVGFFVNLLIQRFDLEKDQSLDAYLKQVNKKFSVSQEFQDFPFDKKQEILQKQGIKDILSSPAFIYQSYAIPQLKLDEEIAELVLPKQAIIFDMRKTCRFGYFTLFAQENGQELSFVIEYAKDLFSESFIKRIAENLLHTIRNVCSNPNQMLHDISVVCVEERNKLISLGQGPKLDYSEDDNLVNKFKRNVKEYPNNIALSFGGKSLNYEEMDQQTTNLAHALIEKGVQQGNYVGIYLDPSHLFYIAELAILKVGAVFIPLSKESPNERLEKIINDAKINFFIVDDNTGGLFDTNCAAQLISIMATKSVNLNKSLPVIVKSIEDTFCVLYTSGCTGMPKGVVLPEKGILRVVGSPNFIQVSPGDKVAQTANQAFDAAQLECWLAWNHGASLVLFDKKTILNVNSFRKKLKDKNITHMWLTAGLFDAYANDKPDLFKSLKYLMVGGDVVHKKAILNVLNLEKPPIIINGYGPTEASIFALTHTFDKQTINNYTTTLVGSPINETEVEILTLFATKTPLGGIGELCIKGNGVGGYLNSPNLNEEKFSVKSGKRNYLTGDLVKYTIKKPEIMFIGRGNDEQVKINGYLVTPEEVRNCLSQHPAIKQIHVSTINRHGTNQLVAFYTLANKASIQPTKKELNDYLKEFLESYKFPSHYQQVDDFLLNPNGKVDTKQFKGIELKLNDNQEKVTNAETPYQKELLEIIRESLVSDNHKDNLELDEVRKNSFPDNIKFDLFNIVTNSIKQVEIINRINAKFESKFKENYKEKPEEKLQKYLEKIYFTVNELFMNPTIEKLADLLTKKLNNKTEKKWLRLLKNGHCSLPPIVLIHPAGGGLAYFNKLIEHVTFENPCYGIEDPLLDSNQLKLLSMEHMARNYLNRIENEIQGPFFLGGYSFGGMLALEMAAQYEDKSENQHLLEVILFDTWVVAYASDQIKNELKKDVLVHCEKQRKKTTMHNMDDDVPTIQSSLKQLCEWHQKIGFEFKPRKLLSTKVCLFRANKYDDKFATMNIETENNYLSHSISETYIKKYNIKSTHYDLLENLKENHLAEDFTAHIEAIEPNKSSKKCQTVSKANQVMLFTLSQVNKHPSPLQNAQHRYNP